MYKKCNAHSKVVVLLIKPIVLLLFSLQSRSGNLKSFNAFLLNKRNDVIWHWRYVDAHAQWRSKRSLALGFLPWCNVASGLEKPLLAVW